ncbi:hypothetical protein GBF38_001734, partial [Nibea albiflora]
FCSVMFLLRGSVCRQGLLHDCQWYVQGHTDASRVTFTDRNTEAVSRSQGWIRSVQVDFMLFC